MATTAVRSTIVKTNLQSCPIGYTGRKDDTVKYHKFNHYEYTDLIRNCAYIADRYTSNDTTDMLIELAQVKFDDKNLYFEVSESLMQRIAVANICDMAFVQFHDSNGEIDYAGLGDFSELILRDIVNNINLYGCEI